MKEKWKIGLRKFDQPALLHHQAVLHYTLPPLPFHLLLIIIILLHLLLILLLLLLFKQVWKALQALPPLLQAPAGSKILTGFKLFTNYKVVTGITRL